MKDIDILLEKIYDDIMVTTTNTERHLTELDQCEDADEADYAFNHGRLSGLYYARELVKAHMVKNGTLARLSRY